MKFIPHFRLPALCFSFAVAAAPLVAAELNVEPLVPMGADKAIEVPGETWPHFNWASFDQDKVVSFGDFQYSAYWNDERVLTLVRRNLSTDEIQALAVADFQLADGLADRHARDAHRNIVLGISPGDGRLHLSWDHHNNDLNYTRSRAGFITDPPSEISLDDLESQQALMEGAPQRVTYPRFFNNHEEKLFFFYRSGGSGAGDIALFEYDHADGEWAMISEQLFGREGLYPDWDDSDSRNAYMHDLLFDGDGRLHVTWVYRERSRTWASNHDLHYAYSDDEGRTWKNNEGEQIADTREGEQITLDSPGIRVWEIPVFSWLMNQCAMTIDSQNRPHVATYHMEGTFRPDDLKHNPPSSEDHRFRYFHYWRDNDGEWHRSDPLPVPSPRRRPMIVAGPDDTLVIYFSTEDGFAGHIAGAEDGWKEWSTVRLTGPQYRVNDISKPDRRRLRQENVLSFTADPRGRKKGSGFAFLDFDVARILAAANPDQ